MKVKLANRLTESIFNTRMMRQIVYSLTGSNLTGTKNNENMLSGFFSRNAGVVGFLIPNLKTAAIFGNNHMHESRSRNRKRTEMYSYECYKDYSLADFFYTCEKYCETAITLMENREYALDLIEDYVKNGQLISECGEMMTATMSGDVVELDIDDLVYDFLVQILLPMGTGENDTFSVGCLREREDFIAIAKILLKEKANGDKFLSNCED